MDTRDGIIVTNDAFGTIITEQNSHDYYREAEDHKVEAFFDNNKTFLIIAEM
jgi:hypothetical protein